MFALVADDVLENRDVLTHLLTDIGVEVVLAEDGQQAVEKVRSRLPDRPSMNGLASNQAR